MRRTVTVTLLLAALGAVRAADGPTDPRRDEILRARAAENAKTPGLVDPHAPVPMEIRTSADQRAGDGAAPFGCVLQRDGSNQLTAPQCLGCHAGAVHSTVSHRVEVSYDEARSRGNERLRPREEAVRRGAFLPEGKVRCTSCHDGKSRLRYRLAIPVDAGLRPAVKPFSPVTFETGPQAALARKVELTALDGFEAAVKPLCLKCHPME